MVCISLLCDGGMSVFEHVIVSLHCVNFTDPDFESELCSLATPLVLRILEVQKKNFGGAPSPEIATTARLTALYFSNVASGEPFFRCVGIL